MGRDPEAAYFQTVEEFFVSRRGDPLFLSNADWLLIRRWRRAGIPCAWSCAGSPTPSTATRTRSRATGRCGSLHYCAAEVEAAAERWQRALALGDGGRASATAISRALADRLEEATPRAGGGGGRRARSRSELRELGAAARCAAQSERWLAAAERKLLRALERDLGEAEVARIEAEVEAVLAPYRERMPEKVLAQVREEGRARRLLEAHGLPRLSLFHGTEGRGCGVSPGRRSRWGSRSRSRSRRRCIAVWAWRRHEGRVVFVPRAFPGDRLRVRVTSGRARLRARGDPGGPRARARDGGPLPAPTPSAAAAAPIRSSTTRPSWRPSGTSWPRPCGARGRPSRERLRGRGEPGDGLAHPGHVPLRGRGRRAAPGAPRGGHPRGGRPRALPPALARHDGSGAGLEGRAPGPAGPVAAACAACTWPRATESGPRGHPRDPAARARRCPRSCPCARRAPGSPASRCWRRKGDARCSCCFTAARVSATRSPGSA